MDCEPCGEAQFLSLELVGLLGDRYGGVGLFACKHVSSFMVSFQNGRVHDHMKVKQSFSARISHDLEGAPG